MMLRKWSIGNTLIMQYSFRKVGELASTLLLNWLPFIVSISQISRAERENMMNRYKMVQIASIFRAMDVATCEWG